MDDTSTKSTRLSRKANHELEDCAHGYRISKNRTHWNAEGNTLLRSKSGSVRIEVTVDLRWNEDCPKLEVLNFATLDTGEINNRIVR